MVQYDITFYCYKLEKNGLSISISKKDSEYLLIETYMTEPLDACISPYTKEKTFIYYIPMLHYLMDIFVDFYKEHITYMMPYSIHKLPPTYYITDICGLSINEYITMTNDAQIQMENSILLYNNIIEDIKSKINKTAFRLLTIKIEKENIESLKVLCIVGDLIAEFL
jgi:hypothetical protein